MTEDQQRHQPKERKSIHEIRNQDLVSRLLAATPPYLYSAPVGPNNFFFSDMLRSLVQARNNENARSIQLQQAVISRRPRKRSWSQQRPYYEHVKERKEMEEKITEKPLELTNKQLFPISAKYSKHDNKDDSTSKVIVHHNNAIAETKLTNEFDQNIPNESPNGISEPPTVSLPSSDLVLPPPPPVWYPPIYPPYGIDPLHFFIDLRVSGHIYDRKKENLSPLANSENNNILPPSTETETFGKQRHGSAFTVPAPRNESKTSSAINLSASNVGDKIDSSYNKYYDLSGDSKENHPNSKNANYVLQNLPRIYTQFTSRDSDENSFENDNKSDQDLDEINEEQTKENSGLIDVEEVDTVKLRNNDGGSRCRSPQNQSEIHHID